MTKEDLPVTPPPRPADPLTAQDGLRLFTLINDGQKRLEGLFSELSNRLATMQAQVIRIAGKVDVIAEDTAHNRNKRFELELEEAEREKEIAEAALHAIEQKIAKKQNLKDETQDTGERLKLIAASALSEAESQKKKSREERFEDLRWSVTKAVVTWGAIGLVGFVFAVIWFLVQLYLNRGGP